MSRAFWDGTSRLLIVRCGSFDPGPASLALFTPESLKQAEDAGEFDVDSNMLGLKPSPFQLVRFIKDLRRTDVSSELFVKLLEGYRELRKQSDADPLRCV